MAAANVSRIYGVKGYTNTVVTACAAGTQAIGEAAVVIQRGVSDVVVSGGCEAGICELGLGGFNVIKALSRYTEDPANASRPFDSHRDGFVPAEGAGILVMESLEHAVNRGANILAEVVGYGVSSDAFHAVQPEEDGSGAARAIRWALEDADLQPQDISYINAHGTSTPINDRVETLAIKKAFGEYAYKVPISSSKSMIGHVLGGAGALEAIASIKTIEAGMIARELLDRGLAKRLGVVCAPHLCDQWAQELSEKFNIDTAVIQPSQIGRLERGLPRRDVSIYQYYRHLVVSIDYIKSQRNKGPFLDNCPDLIIVDEAHNLPRRIQSGLERRLTTRMLMHAGFELEEFIESMGGNIQEKWKWAMKTFKKFQQIIQDKFSDILFKQINRYSLLKLFHAV